MNSLVEKAKELGLVLTTEQVEKFARYLYLLAETNKKFNLTAVTEEREVVDKHFIDSLSAARFFMSGAAADIGSGAGFPALPLAIIKPDMTFTLVDSLNKRVEFLRDVIRELSLKNAVAIHARAEDFCMSNREKFDYATARAVAALPTLAEYCLPLVKIGGSFIAYKTQNEDIAAAQNAIKILGGAEPIPHGITLPKTNIRRLIVVTKKTSPTPQKYPRNKNLPKLKPL